MTQRTRTHWLKWLLFAGIVIVAGIGYTLFGDLITIEQLSLRESEFREYQKEQPFLVYGVAFLVYVSVTGLSLPGAAVLTLTCGWLFGLWGAVVLVSFASTAGATIAFLVSRYLLHDLIQDRFGERLATFNRSLEREGAFYLFLLRLIPAVPFFVVNVVMGLTPLKTRTFWWVSQLGMIPGTIVYVYAGASVPSLSKLAEEGARGILTPQLLFAFCLLGVIPLVIKKIVYRIRPSLSKAVTKDDEESHHAVEVP